jgi:hypothetical protein
VVQFSTDEISKQAAAKGVSKKSDYGQSVEATSNTIVMRLMAATTVFKGFLQEH